MGNFRRDDRSGGRSFGQRDFGRRSFSDRGPREMHQAVCSTCGKDCEVPFRPTGDKPVYCSQCFEKSGGRDNPRPQNNEQLESINHKLDKILDILTKPKTEVKETKTPKKKTVS
ncbi:MAG: CxxC-x17-CxxC domain-containing protein [Candidatus Shapirobacteria bacterium]